MTENSDVPATQDESAEPPVKIYSRRAIMGFSIFFSTMFGAALLYQNLKSIGKRKDANAIFILSILYSILGVAVITKIGYQSNYAALTFNLIGGILLSNHFYNKFFPLTETYQYKAIWKPLIISLLISLPFAILVLRNGALQQ